MLRCLIKLFLMFSLLSGFYVFPEMMNRIMDSNYYGIPKNMDFDGVLPTGGLCQTYTRQGIRNSG